MHPDILNQFYGTEGPPLARRAGQTGAGHAEDEENPSILCNLESSIAGDQESDIRHEPVEVPAEESPFHPDIEEIFFRSIA